MTLLVVVCLCVLGLVVLIRLLTEDPLGTVDHLYSPPQEPSPSEWRIEVREAEGCWEARIVRDGETEWVSMPCPSKRVAHLFADKALDRLKHPERREWH